MAPVPPSSARYRPLPQLLEVLIDTFKARGAIALTRPARAWRSLLAAGPTPTAPPPPNEPFSTHSWHDGESWTLWIGLEGIPPAAIALVGIGAPPSEAEPDRAELSAAVAVHYYRNETERERQRVRKLREEIRLIRAEGAAEREHLETRLLTQRLEVREGGDAVDGSGATPWIVVSEVMQSLTDQVDRWAASDLPLLLWGESGTGKTELLDRLSREVEGPFITENCAALPESLLEVELFGSVPGAFTGADRVHAGLLERCAGGTLVLDHLDELPTPLQAKLLQVLDSGKYRPLGSEEEKQADFRLAVTLRDEPNDLIERGALRPELYYRLQGIEVFVPPLRDRQEEIEPLIETYLQLSARMQARPVPTVHPDALRRLIASPWPGNVRELVNATQRWLIEARTVIRLEDVETDQASSADAPPVSASCWSGDDWRTETDRFHEKLLREALGRFEGNQTHAADALGISRRHLQNLLNKLGFRDEPPEEA